MSLVPDYGDSSGDSDEDLSSSELEVKDKTQTTTPKADKLPTPDFINTEPSQSNYPTTSVFTNPFIEAEIAKKAILEKHVKMVNTKDNTITINGKKICWNYRKGRCRFGHNCKYAHDSDLQKTKEQLELENQVQETVICTSKTVPPVKHSTDKNKRKRPGLTEGLVPGKKVLQNYAKQRKVM